MDQWTVGEIREKMQRIKRQYKKVVSNYYTVSEECWYDICQTEHTIVFGRCDGMVYRVYYYTAAAEELSSLLNTYPSDATIDLIAKEKEDLDMIFQQLLAADYHQHAVFERYHVPNLKEKMYANLPKELQDLDINQVGQYAEEAEAEEILQLLKDTFDSKESHFQSLQALRAMAKNRHILIVREKNTILTLVAFQLQGKKIYIEQVVNKGPKAYMHCLYSQALERAVREGINYAYTWVDSKNEKGKGLARRYGQKQDGIKDYIFVKDEQ